MNTLIAAVVKRQSLFTALIAAFLFSVILALTAVGYECDERGTYVRDFIYWNVVSINCSPRNIIYE